MANSVTFRRLLAGTTALSVPLILVGVYTAIAGFGLTCEARWPLCDGAVFGLFPANWGSFVEWFHRLIAMVFGFAILGTIASALRQSIDRRILAALGLATLLTPLQIVFGALTVTTYEQVILAAHFSTAIGIFSLLATATILTGRLADTAPDLGSTAATTGGLLLVAVPITPRFLFAPSAEVHVLYYAFALLGLGGLLAGAVLTTGRARNVAITGAAVLAFGMVLSRLTVTAIAPSVLVGTTIVATLAGAAAAIAIYAWRDRGIEASVDSSYSSRPN